MKVRATGANQRQAATIAGISERSGQRIEAGGHQPGRARKRDWRTRSDPLVEVWENELEPMLRKEPRLQPTTLYEYLEKHYPGQYGSVLRTLQRRVSEWKAHHGPPKDVMFELRHEPGVMGLSDFTELKGVTITIKGERFKHLIYHYRLAYSGWRYAQIIQGGESFIALSEGLQNALSASGGSPRQHRTDSLSAAYRNAGGSHRKRSTVARAEFSANPTVPKRGRPRQWGAKIKLRDLFEDTDSWLTETVSLYGQPVSLVYQCFQFYWDSPTEKVLFVLTQQPCGTRMILISSDLSLTGLEVIETYTKRFKIEVAFRTFVHLLGGFAYRFWLKALDKITDWPDSMYLLDYDTDIQTQILGKVEAFERFVNLNVIALGLLQVLALEMPNTIWKYFPGWFRTLPKHGYPTERIVRMALQDQQEIILSKSMPTLLLSKLLAGKIGQRKTPKTPALTV